MTEHVGFLAELTVRAVLDGELVAFGDDGKPDFELVCERTLQRHAQIPLTFLAFDVLRLDGRDLRQKPYAERRGILEALVQLRSVIVTAPDPLREELRGLPLGRLLERCSRLRRSRTAAPDQLAVRLVLRTLARRIEAVPQASRSSGTRQ